MIAILTGPSGGFVDPVSNSFCKLLVALGEQSTSYFATNIISRVTVSPSGPSRSYLVQAYLRTLLSYTGLPGYAGIDEEESEMTLAFWYLFQESLWTADYHPDFDEGGTGPSGLEGDQATVTQALYRELVQILRRKVVWPSDSPWPRGEHLYTPNRIDLTSTYRPVREIPSVRSLPPSTCLQGIDLTLGIDVTSVIL